MNSYNCRVCRSEYREQIEEALNSGGRFRDTAREYTGHFDCDLHLLEQSLATHQKKHIDQNIPKELTSEEVNFLNRLEEGRVTLEEASRIVATKVFEKILKNPDDVRFIDFFRSELLKIKQQETNYKENYAMEMINRLFAGNLPPRECPNCGAKLFNVTLPKPPSLNGEIIDS